MRISILLNALLTSCTLMASEAYDAQKIADIFIRLNQDKSNPKKKVNHAKGFCAAGVFEPNKDALNSINLPILERESIPAQIRYSLGGAFKSDKTKTRGMAIKLAADNDFWTMVMLNTPINFARTPEEFGKFFEMRLPINGKIDHENIKKQMQEVKSYRNFTEFTKDYGVTPSVANTPFFSVHTFWFMDKDGKDLAARWRFEPVSGVKYLNEDELKAAKDEFLMSDLQNKLKNSPVEYKMYITLANSDDITDSTTAVWKGEHKEIKVGTLKVINYEGDICDADVYFPNELPKGIKPPKDPLFEIRNEVYAVTFGHRQ